MNESNNSKNIFEAVGQSRKIVKQSSLNQKTQEISGLESVSINPAELIDLNPDPEINLILNKMVKVKESFESKLNEIYEDNGLTQMQVESYLNNPSNFSPQDWSKIQTQRDELENQINIVLNKSRKKSTGLHDEKSQQSKDRKAKTLGSRKNWIPM